MKAASHMSYSLNCLKGDYIGDYYRGKGDTRSLDNGSHEDSLFLDDLVFRGFRFLRV